MLNARRVSLALTVLCISLSAFLPAAIAAGPASVTVRVEGLTETKLPPTQVTTTSEPVVKDGKAEDSCPGTSAAGALELATHGSWSGKWYGGEVKNGSFAGLGYSVETIEGESYPFSGATFWDLWINNKAEEAHGVCGAEIQQGNQVLLFPCHYEAGKECPTPLGVEAPASADVGEKLAVKVVRYSSAGQASAVPGAAITGAAEPATADSSGNAFVTFSGAGAHTLQITAPESVRTEATVCVHKGNDGTCGTQAPSTTSTGPATSVALPGGLSAPYRGPFALVAHTLGVSDGRVYAPAAAPRLLAGTVSAHSPVTSVSLRISREYRGRCFAYDGARGRFVGVRCGRGSYFKVATGGSYSYLLPAKLARGRYVLDVLATDAAGNRTTLARGTSRIVFYVR